MLCTHPFQTDTGSIATQNTVSQPFSRRMNTGSSDTATHRRRTSRMRRLPRPARFHACDVWPRIVYVAVGVAAILDIPGLLATLRGTSTGMDTGVRGEPATYR